MKHLAHIGIALAILAASPLWAQAPMVPSPRLRAAEAVDYWPGKYVKLPMGEVKAPAKLTYVTITKAGEDYQIEGFEGRTFRTSNLKRSLDEVLTSSIITKPVASFGLGTATLQGHGVIQIIIEALNGNERFYLVRAEPLK